MKKFASMFMALVMVFTMGPNMVVRAEEDKAAKAEEKVLKAIDLVERCVDHPKLCAYGASAFLKTVLEEKIEPGFEAFLKSVKNYNYADVLAEVDKSKLAKYPSLKDLTEADNVSFSQVCGALKTVVKSVAANHSSDKNTKEDL